MSPVWTSVLGVGAATVALKATGPVLLGRRELPSWLAGPVSLLAPAVLAAFVVTQTLGGHRDIVADARLVGLGAGAIAIALRAPILAVVVVAAAAAALTRLEKIVAVRSSVFVYLEWFLRDTYGVKIVPESSFTSGLVGRGIISLGMG